jgi:glutaredoxin
MIFVSFFHQVPRVFIGGKFIGGGNETAELHRKKELGKMLQKIGAIL